MTIDGIELETGTKIAITFQTPKDGIFRRALIRLFPRWIKPTPPPENGIYVVTASGSPQ